MGRLLLSVVYSDKGTTSTWYDPETGIETQRQIANKDNLIYMSNMSRDRQVGSCKNGFGENTD
jgi:hypothetical protein